MADTVEVVRTLCIDARASLLGEPCEAIWCPLRSCSRRACHWHQPFHSHALHVVPMCEVYPRVNARMAFPDRSETYSDRLCWGSTSCSMIQGPEIEISRGVPRLATEYRTCSQYRRKGLPTAVARASVTFSYHVGGMS